MIRVLEIDPSYYHGGAHLFLMIYYASRPPMMGGRPEAAMSHYRSLKALQGEDFPMADLFYARHYLLRAQDRIPKLRPDTVWNRGWLKPLAPQLRARLGSDAETDQADTGALLIALFERLS